MNEDQVRQSLDQMGVPRYDPIRSEAWEFAQRDQDDKLLWLFIESRRKPNGAGMLERSLAGAGGGTVVLLGLVAHALGLTDKVMPK